MLSHSLRPYCYYLCCTDEKYTILLQSGICIHTHTPSERARKTAEAVIAISEKQTSLTHAKSHTKLKPTWPKTAHIQDYAHTVYLPTCTEKQKLEGCLICLCCSSWKRLRSRLALLLHQKRWLEQVCPAFNVSSPFLFLFVAILGICAFSRSVSTTDFILGF